MSAKFEIRANAGNTLKVIEQITGAVDKTGKAAEGSVKSVRQLNAEAQRIKEALDPQEKLNRKYAELKKHVDAGRLSMGQATAEGMKLRQSLEGAAKSGDQAFGSSALSSLQSYVTGALGIGAAVGLIRKELDIIAQRAEKRTQLAMTTADAEASLRKVVATDKDRDAMLSGAKSIAETSHIPEAQIYQAAAATYGAIGNVPDSLAALEEATKQSRDPAAIQEISAGIGFVMQSTRIKSAKEAVGLLNQVLAGSPIEDAKVPQSYAKVAAAFMSPTAGGSAATAGAFLASLSQASADTQGDRSRTGAIDFIAKSQEYFEKNGRRYGVSKADSDEVDERIALLMSNKEMAKDFISKTTFEAPVRGGMASMFLTDEGRATYAENLAGMEKSNLRVAAADDTAGFIKDGKLQATKTLNNIVASNSDSLELDKEGLLTQESYDKMVGMIADQWGGPFANTRARAYYGGTTAWDGVDTLEAIHMLSSNRPTGTDAESQKVADKFDLMIAEMRALRQQQRAKVTTQQE